MGLIYKIRVRVSAQIMKPTQYSTQDSVIFVDTVSGREVVGAKVNQQAVGYQLTARPCQMECFYLFTISK